MKKLHIGILVVMFSIFLMGCPSDEQLSLDENTVCGVGEDCENTNAAPTALSQEEYDAPEEAVALDDSVIVSLSEVTSQVKKYTHLSNGVEVNYIVVLGSDGEVRTAFDACEVCGGSQGYAQDGTDVMCRKCGRYFTIDGLGTQNKGRGCWPAYLPHTIDGDSIIIKKSELDKGRFLFA